MNFYYDMEIDFHGQTVDEVLPQLEEILFVESAKTIMIIHGKGSGRLRQAVRGFIRKCEYIKGFDYGENINIPGGDGVTVVYT